MSLAPVSASDENIGARPFQAKSSSSSSSSSSFIFKTSIFPCSAMVRRSSRNEAPPHIPEHCLFRVQTKLLHTFIPSLPLSTRTSQPCHHHISTGWRSIIPTLMFHMPKPPQSTLPHHLIDTVHQEDCTNPHCVSYPSVTLRTSVSPSSDPFSPDFADSLSSSPRFQSHMSMLLTQTLYIFLFMRYDAPQAVRIVVFIFIIEKSTQDDYDDVHRFGWKLWFWTLNLWNQ